MRTWDAQNLNNMETGEHPCGEHAQEQQSRILTGFCQNRQVSSLPGLGTESASQRKNSPG
ncbi:hypothetical protein PC116_g31082 [Phytophthora cactorum]|nr:hypothetical protein PC116_g31082 [Phytophthora cactorum]